MKKYTFIAEFNKGTYVNQFISDNILVAMELWLSEMEQIFGAELKNHILFEVEHGDETPTQLKTIDNVWYLLFIYKKYKVYLHIILTV